MTKREIPELVQLFTHLLWVNSPKDWVLKSAYFKETLFISMLLDADTEQQHQKIRRSFGLDTIRNRANDLYGLAADCIDEMKTEVKK